MADAARCNNNYNGNKKGACEKSDFLFHGFGICFGFGDLFPRIYGIGGRSNNEERALSEVEMPIPCLKVVNKCVTFCCLSRLSLNNILNSLEFSMVKMNKNTFSDSFSGGLSNQLYFRVVNGNTYASKMPRKRKKKKYGDWNKENSNFMLASVFAKFILTQPELRALYDAKASGFNNAYTLAIADYLKVPEITGISARGYKGKPGARITITVSNIVQVASVKLQILLPDNTILEQESAIPSKQEGAWIYKTTAETPAVKGITLHVKVKDIPDHLVIKDFPVS